MREEGVLSKTGKRNRRGSFVLRPIRNYLNTNEHLRTVHKNGISFGFTEYTIKNLFEISTEYFS